MVYLSQHEARPEHGPEEDISYTPSQEEEQLVRKLEGLFQRAKRAKSKYDYNWPELYKLYRGKQWKEQRPSYRASEVWNLIWEAIQTQVPVQVDARPKFDYLPQEPSDRDFADLMNDIASADWERQNYQATLLEVIYDANIYGTGLSELKFDPKKNCILYKSKSPFCIFPDPSAENFKYRCSYTVDAEPMDVSKIKRLFPDKAQVIKADVVDFVTEKRVEIASYRAHSGTSDQFYTEASGGMDSKAPAEVLVKTFYCEDDEVIEIAGQEGENGELSKPEKRLKYPGGRKTVIANNVVLSDDECEYDDETMFPYQRLVNYINQRCFWGIGEVEPLESPQRTFNKLVSFVLDVLQLAGNPVWVVSSDSGVFTENLTNQPGLVIEKHPNSEVSRQEGVQLQPYVLQLIDRWKEWFERASGSQDISRGIAPGSVTAASAIADLQNAAQSRIRLKMKQMDAYLQDLGQSYASRVMQFYTAPQVFRLTGKDGTERFFKMHMQKDEAGQTQAVVQRYTEQGQIDPNIQVYQLRGKLDVRVTTGSSLPFSKTEAANRAYQLFDRGIVDAEEVLKSLDYPNAEAILARVQRKQMEAQQMETQQRVPS